VKLGLLQRVDLAGLTGLVPLLVTGPVSAGPGPVERSSVTAPAGLHVFIDPLASLAYRQLVLGLHINGPEVTIVQGEGFSWAGYPDDTTPSSRDFLPGLSGLLLAGATPSGQHSSSGEGQGRPDPRRISSSSSGSSSSKGSTSSKEAPQPPIALGRVSLYNARLAILSVQEVIPRYLEHVTGTITLGYAYR
jgi:hypothetical protein